MRSIFLLPIVCGLSLTPSVYSQAAPAKGLQCSLQLADKSEATRALNRGDYATAESAYRSALGTPSALGYVGLVRAQLGQEHTEQALASAQKAAAAFPTSADVQAVLGDALTRSGQVPEASAAYARAFAIDRCSAAAHLGWARLNDLVGKHATAAREYSIAHRLAPASPVTTAAYLESIPAEQRVAPLRGFLAEEPALPPAETARLTAEVHRLEQHQTCRVTTDYNNAKIPMLPLLLDGRTVRGWGLKVGVNEASLPLFELDSTASGIVLNPRDAAKAEVHPADGMVPSTRMRATPASHRASASQGWSFTTAR